MRKRLIAAVATAMLGFSASTATAQVATTITLGPVEVYSGGNVGNSAWNVTSTVGLGSNSLTSFVAYCFDNKRLVKDVHEYYALTFLEFLTGAGAGPGGAPANFNTVDLLDLNTMVSLISGVPAGGYVHDIDQPWVHAINQPIQTAVWAIGNNEPYAGPWFGGPVNSFSNSWMVLVSKAEWDAGLNGQNGFQGGQSFLVEVPGGGLVTPEPSTYVLMAAGLAGLGIVARRRRVS